MRLSVIVTTYNRPDALKKVLEGLTDQSLAPDEVIVADDGSGPETRRLVGTMAAKATYRLDHVWQPNEGFRAAAIRNAAIRRSVGDYLVCLDGDCIPAKSFVQDHRQLAEAGCFVQGGRVLVSPRLSVRFEVQRARRPIRLFGDLIHGDLGNAHHLLHLPFWPPHRSRRLSGIRSCNMGFFRSDLHAVNGFNEDFVGWGREDSELAVRLFRYGLRCKRHPFMAVCFHLWHPENERSRLGENDRRLEQQKANTGFVCAHGLVRSGGSR